MLRRITLENFMSHKHTVIDLADGLTVLTGPNNCGKSAVVAALQILASNGKSTHVMRHGAKVCRITVETDDGHVICWQRKKSSVSYTLDGVDVHRVGQSVPDGLDALLKMPVVEADAGRTKVSYDIHFGEQKAPIFLLGDPGSRAASFFAAASDASRLLEMTVKHRSNVKEKRQAAKRLTTDLQASTAELQRLQPVVALEARLDVAEKLFQAITNAVSAVMRLEKLIDGVQREIVTCRQLRTELQTLAQITVPPEQHNTPAVDTVIRNIEQTLARMRTANAAIQASRSLHAPPTLEATAECRRLLGDLTTTASRSSKLQTEAMALEQLQDPPQLHATTEITRQIAAIQQVSQHSVRLRQQSAALQTLTPPETLHELAPLSRLIDDLRSRHQKQQTARRVVKRLSSLTLLSPGENTGCLRDVIAGLKAAAEQVGKQRTQANKCRDELTECERCVRQFVEQNPRCGTCGADLDPDRLLSAVPGLEAHGHG